MKTKYIFILLIMSANIVFSQDNNGQNILLTGTKWIVIPEEGDEDSWPSQYIIEFLENNILFDSYPNDGHCWEQKNNIIIIYWSNYTATSVGFIVSENIIRGILINSNGYFGNFRMERIIN